MFRWRWYFLSLLLGFLFTAHAHAQSGFVYLLPHQDDEMFLAGSIAHNVQAGKKVYAVIVTDGSASKVFGWLNQLAKSTRAVDCLKNQCRGFPGQLLTPLTIRQFIEARNREFIASMETLGVPRSHIILANTSSTLEADHNSFRDGHLTVPAASTLIRELSKELGMETFVTLISDPTHPEHPDHRTLSIALQNASEIKDKIFYSEDPIYSLPIKLSLAERRAKIKALDQYFVWNPKQGRYAIAAHSVRKLLLAWQYRHFEYVL